MSDTTEEAARRARHTSPTVDAVVRQLGRQVGSQEAELVARFAELFFSKASTDFLHERSTDALAHMAVGSFRFLEQSSPGRVDVEVLNPDVDNEGWYAPVTVIRTNISERPFVVDTIQEYLHAEDLAIEHLIYPVLHVARGEDRSITDLGPSLEGASRESLVHCEISRVTDPDVLARIRSELSSRLQDVVRATDDFQPMVRQLAAVEETLKERSSDLPGLAEELREMSAFLRWLKDGAFVFLGYRGYDLVDVPGQTSRCILVEPGSGLGILRNEADSRYAEPVAIEDLDEGLKPLIEGGPLLIVSKTNAEAPVHRRARMDYVGIKKIGPDGTMLGEHRFVGLFTSKAFAAEAEKIPILREKLLHTLEEAGVQEGTHDFKEIITIFNSMPREELFLTSVEEIGADVRTVLTTYQTQDVRVTLRRDLLRRGLSVMIILPEERFSGEIRRNIEAVLVEAFQGVVLNYHLALGEGDQARLHFYIAPGFEDADQVDVADLERKVVELIRSWSDQVREGLKRVRPPDEARRMARRYGEAFGAEYRAATAPSVAVQDILEIEAMAAGDQDVAITCSNDDPDPAASELGPVTQLKLYLRGARLVLSDFMPILEGCGLRIIAVTPFEVEEVGVGRALIYAFEVQDAAGKPLDVEERGSLLAQTVLAVRRRDTSNDILNALVLSAGLHWREVDVLRAYVTYAFQVRMVTSRQALLNALTSYPSLARLLFEIFEVRFDPRGPSNLKDRERVSREFELAFKRGRADVDLLADDRALRRLFLLIKATVRTNYYRNGGQAPTRRSGGVPYISLKFAVRHFERVFKTRLLYEVWVRSSRMEGIHLRGARVARGGIRWSDRLDDFRREVLGLVKTQMVKNAVIVPSGSKGGFIPLRHLPDPEDRLEEGKAQYETLIRGLLDLTDNLADDGSVVAPEGVVCHDAPDPYLVVAADKGTARFSDLANAVAAEYDFWLGDAFASGGSHGYDHKAVGITARGGWECVKRHFREAGKDIQKEPFTVIGIGDMGGDVFGNGMLASSQIRLLAAFDHRHVLIDPDPDPKRSYEERLRIFQLGESSWDDYDRSVLSEGGEIISRGAKEVELSTRAREVLGIGEDEGPLDGESLIRAVLKAPAELLWNGGIGTYVKASSESSSGAGDPSNNAVRIDADELRCEVVGEGGNLGFTQLARIEYAAGGGRINTDAIDNSGGVDLSDREVNLKILLDTAVRGGAMPAEDRNRLLGELTDAIAELVLADSRSQSLAVSLDQLRVASGSDEFKALMTALEKEGHLDRAAEHLPSMEQLVDRYAESGQGLHRPELCVILAYAKLHLMSCLLRSDLPDDPETERYLRAYFPAQALKAAGDVSLQQHRLRREIIASQVTNAVVDLMGAAFVHRLSRDTGRPPADVVRAWLVSTRLAGHRSLLASMAAQDWLPASVAYRWLRGLGRVLNRTTRWVLANVEPDVSMAEVITGNLAGLAVLREHFGELVEGEDRRVYEVRVAEIQELGADEELAGRLITLRFLDQLLEIIRIAKESRADPLDTARTYYRVSEEVQVPWLRGAVLEAARDDRWEQRAAQALVDDLTRAHHGLVVSALRATSKGGAGTKVGRLSSAHWREVQRFRNLVEEVQSDVGMGLAGLSVAVREMTLLSDRLSRNSK